MSSRNKKSKLFVALLTFQPKNTCTKEDTTAVFRYIMNNAEKNALVLLGKTRGIRDHRMMLFPSWKTKKSIYENINPHVN